VHRRAARAVAWPTALEQTAPGGRARARAQARTRARAQARGLAALAAAAAVAALAAPGCFAHGCGDGGGGGPPEATFADCTNGADDDGDGAADCADDGCGAFCGACTPGPCAPGFARCIEGTDAVYRCDASGTQLCPAGACGDGQACVGFTCGPETCISGDRVCDGNGLLNECLAGTWIGPTACAAGDVCDPTTGDACQPQTCTPGQPFCAAAEVVEQCSAFGVPTGAQTPCTDGGLCVDGACASACDEPGACEWLFVPADRPPESAADVEYLVVSNGTPYPAAVYLEERAADGTWTTAVSRGVGVGATADVMMEDRHVTGTARAPRGAWRVRANVPVSIHVLDDVEAGSPAAAAFAPWPTARLGTDYRVATMPHNGLGDGPGTPPAPHPGGLAVVATADGTTVTVTPSAPTAAGGTVPALSAGEVYTAALDAGDVLQIETGADGADLTGTRVTADAPVALLAFHTCATLDGVACDKIAEMMAPVARWGTRHAVATLDAGDLVRVVAATDGSMVTLVTWDACLPDQTVSVDAGGFADFVAPPPDAVGMCPWVVTATAPVLVAEVLGGAAPSLVLARPDEARVGDMAFGNAPWQTRLLASYAGGGVGVGFLLDGASPASVVVGPDGTFFLDASPGLAALHRLSYPAGAPVLAAWILGSDAPADAPPTIGWAFDPAGAW
jgi:hypothetical protein